ncbi:C2H2-type domain-containing protein [Pleurotus pulmonarius]|nr:hypothetical protein EYR38_006342 [Pleurotus pulmonarius]
MHHHTRNYSYDGQSPYPTSQPPPHQGTSYAVPPTSYQRSQYDPMSAQLYVPSNAPPNPQYPRSMTVSPEAQQYASMQPGYVPHPHPPYYNGSYDQSSQSPVVTAQTPQFIPTPSDFVGQYAAYPANARPMSPNFGREYYGSPEYQHGASSSQIPPQHSSRYTGSRPRSTAPISPTSTSSPTGERYPCDKCSKTFSRSHDRKRHHETQHLATPVVHRCRYCDKEFSRADSLKRHLDNGCDERPQ